MKVWLNICFCLLVSSCGYKLGKIKRSLPGNVKTVAVPVFENKTNIIGIESAFTNSMIEELVRSSSVQVVSQENAEAVIEGRITDVEFVKGADIAANSDSNKLPSGTYVTGSYTVHVYVNIRLRRRSDNKILWVRNLSGVKSFNTAKVGSPTINTVNALYNHSARLITIDSIAKELMLKAQSYMTEEF